ncbi:MAG: carotenoid oxygenase family protein [Acidimicrobiales bacterium]
MIGSGWGPALPMEGSLPPDLQGTLFRVGPATVPGGRGGVGDGGGGAGGGDGRADGHGVAAEGKVRQPGGALHAVELRDGKAVTFLSRESDADAGVFWHAGSVLALPETGLPSQYSRLLEPEGFSGGLTVPIASHVHRVAADGSRVLFAVDDGVDRRRDGAGGAGNGASADAAVGLDESDGIWLRLGEWEAGGGLRSAQSVALERATWQHDIAVTTDHVVFIESPTARLPDASGSAVPFGWVPGAEGWVGVVRRGGDGSGVRWIRLDPCLVTHVLGAREIGRGGEDGIIELYVCRYEAPETGQPVDLSASVVGPEGIGLTAIGGSLGLLERWRIEGDRLERVQVDERHVEYPRMDALCEGSAFRYGYCVEMMWGDGPVNAGPRRGPGRWETPASPEGLLKFDLDRSEVAAWNPGPWRRASEPIFVRADDGRSDDEGWLLTVVDDANTGTSHLYVLDASTMGRGRAEAIIHLPERLPLRSHGEWVPAARYR